MTVNPRHWWTLRALGGNPLTRRADRIQAWAVVAGLVLLITAAHQAADYSQTVYAANSRSAAAEAATRHPVEATALSASTSTTKGQIPVATVAFSDHVQWFAGNTTHDEVVRVDHAVKAGDRLRIWLDDGGKVTTPPSTDRDAKADSIGVAALLWLVCLSLVAGGLAILRRMLDRVRTRAWDRELRLLVEDGGGSSTKRTP